MDRPWTPSAATRLVGVIGDPVRHSLSPAMHNAAFRALDLDWVYVALPVPAGQGREAVQAARVLGLDGLSVTMPHKADVAAAVDRLSPAAAVLGAVNTVVRTADGLTGENTDVDGFLSALREDEGFDPAGRRCAVLGAGGAGRAVVHALHQAGAAEIAVVARRPGPAQAAADLAGERGRVGGGEAVEGADLVVNATPVGMPEVVTLDGSDLPVDPSHLRSGQLVVDLIYEPPVTPLMAAARSQGATAVNGLGMLLHQAARAFRLWTGEEAPMAVMSAAAGHALAHRRDQSGRRG